MDNPSLPASTLSEPRRILVRGVNWLGDAVMTTPALQRLHEKFPRAHITLLTHEKLAQLWLHHPNLSEVLTFTARESPWSVGRRLRAKHFDLALVLPNSPRSALEVWWAGIPARVGYARPWRNWFLSQTVPPAKGLAAMRKRTPREINLLVHSAEKGSAGRGLVASQATFVHHIQVYLRLVGALGANVEPLAPRLEVGDDEIRTARAKTLANGSGKAESEAGTPPFWIGLNPSAAYGPAKRWPAENFATAVREISRKVSGCRLLAFGGPGDVKLCDEIATRAGVTVINLAGKTTLRELMALLKLCRVLLTNDSGPMHVAAALGTPVVVPFGSTSPELTGPGLPGSVGHFLLKSNAPCSPCFRRTCPIDLRCMTGITVEQVVDAVLSALKIKSSDAIR